MSGWRDAEEHWERRVHRLQAVCELTDLLIRATDPRDVYPPFIDALRHLLGAEAISILLQHSSGPVCAAGREWPAEVVGVVMANLEGTDAAIFGPAGLGRAGAGHLAVENHRSLSAGAPADSGPLALVAFPLVDNGTLRGAVVASFASPRDLTAEDRQLAALAARHLALLVGRARSDEERAIDRDARARAEAHERRAAFLANASRILASSLDYETTLTGVARLAVPEVADWCVVDMVEGDHTLKRLAAAHVDPFKSALVMELHERYPPNPNSRHGVIKVIRSGQSEIACAVQDDWLVRAARDADHLRALRELRLTSYMIVPLVARGRTFGAITFASADAGHRYGPQDLALAEDLGRRASVAVDNAWLYREAQDANRMKDEFLATLSHELRTPLNAVLGWAHLLRKGALDPEAVSRAVEAIERNTKLQAKLVEDLLDVSRIISGKLRLELAPTDLVGVIEAAVDAVKPAADARGIDLKLALDLEIEPIAGDAGRLQQVVWNLLSNAIKFTPEEGRVEVRLTGERSHAVIAVSDTGRGIAPEFLPHVFDRFRQADSSASRVNSGLGLGLAIVRHLVELHGGTIQAESGGLGSGATFRVRLPQRATRTRKEHVPAVQQMLPLDNLPALEGLSVLVVDDEPDARDLLVAVLEQEGARVTAVGSAAAALEALSREPRPDILLSDIAMPHEDGYMLIRRIRALPPDDGGLIPAVAVTAYARAEDRRVALTAGFQAHLTKPVRPIELTTIVGSLARRSIQINLAAPH
jgi:signal transduction histidine kinase/ActR/RegA family two-component response regulator